MPFDSYVAMAIYNFVILFNIEWYFQIEWVVEGMALEGLRTLKLNAICLLDEFV
jgi:hypothetical protein